MKEQTASANHQVPPSAIGVIGAGPAGLTAAYELTKRGYQVDVYEAEKEVGGMSKTISLWGQRVDLGPHRFFSKDARINGLWAEVVQKDYRHVTRLTRVFYRGRFFHYPLKPWETFRKLGMRDGIRSIISYLRQQLLPTRQEESFEAWVINRFGAVLYEKFFKTYSEKLWGISGKELDKDFAAQRIKKLTLFQALWQAIAGDSTKHQSLVERFLYPVQGTGIVYERMADFVRSREGNVFLNTPITGLHIRSENHIVLENPHGSPRHYRQVISTMPLTKLVDLLFAQGSKAKEAALQLSFRNTVLVYLRVKNENLFPDNWLYIHDDRLRVGRITNFSNWVPETKGGQKDTILCMEYWTDPSGNLWQMGESCLIELAKKELEQTTLAKVAEVEDGKVIRIPRCYPVYRKGYKTHVITIAEALSQYPNLLPIGRYGAFKYNNQDHSLLMGLLAADRVSGVYMSNLWDVNTDYGVYQEQSNGKVKLVKE